MNPETASSPHPSREDLYAYRDGELSAERRLTVEAHVVGCRACREAIDEISALEAQLRTAPDAVDESYLDSLTARTMERVRAADTAPRFERRRAAAEIAQAETRARPRFAWPALTAAVGAAATVVVVVGLLIRQPNVWRAAPDVAVLERSAPDAARLGTRADSTVPPPPMAAAPPAAKGKEVGAKKEDMVTKQVVTDENLAALPEESKRRDPATGQATLQVREPAEESRDRAALGGTANQERQETDAVAQRGQMMGAPPIAGAESKASLTKDQAATESVLATTLRRFSLPPVWGPAVSDDLVLRAEPVLRNVYRTGGATTALDSARVRLYLAEAARIHVGSAVPDSATIETITHHYRRAIQLSGADATTRNTASARLEDFQREVSEP